MEHYLILARSITYAQRMQRALERSGIRCQNVPVEIICHSDFKIYRVQSGVGVPGIAVGEMYCRCAVF